VNLPEAFTCWRAACTSSAFVVRGHTSRDSSSNTKTAPSDPAGRFSKTERASWRVSARSSGERLPERSMTRARLIGASAIPWAGKAIARRSGTSPRRTTLLVMSFALSDLASQAGAGRG
jgi:hypothetical protein